MKRRDLKNILVPIDFSEMSERSIEIARRLARRSSASIHLVHVHEYWYPAGFMAPGVPVPMSIATFREEDAERIRKQLQELAEKHDIPTTNCYIRNDIPAYYAVCKVARQIDADLIVIQTHGYTGVTRLITGSHAERVVQHSPCPVLVTRERTRKTRRIRSGAKTGESIDSILVPVDFSQSSFEALEYAIEFAERVTAARLIIFHAVHVGQAFNADGYAMCDLSVLIDEARNNAERQMEKFVRLAKFRGLQFETIIKFAPPASEICEFAEERDIDLIITATHGRTGLKHLLMGSVAEQVVRHAHQPVLVVPSHPETRRGRLTGETRHDEQPKDRPPRRRTLSPSTGRLTKGTRRLLRHPFPERRKTNKFRESRVRG